MGLSGAGRREITNRRPLRTLILLFRCSAGGDNLSKLRVIISYGWRSILEFACFYSESFG